MLAAGTLFPSGALAQARPASATMQAQAQILPDRSISVDSAMEVVHQAETGRHTVSEGNGSTRIWVEVAGAGEQELHEGEVVIVGEGAGAARSRVTELRYRIEGEAAGSAAMDDMVLEVVVEPAT